MFDPKLIALMNEHGLEKWAETIERQYHTGLNPKRWGDIPRWQAAIDELPDIMPASFDTNSDIVRIGEPGQTDETALKETLLKLHPWRKGPFEFFGVHVDTEWHSDWKWNRVKDHVSDLSERVILDVGCGSGYHCWRMAGAGAALTIGIDPTPLFAMQFQAARKYLPEPPAFFVPAGIDDVPPKLHAFDTVFSMGILYHRKSPLEHLQQLRECLKPGGEMVLETLVIDGPEGMALTPQGRYGKMGNVWFIPSVATLENWVRKMKFRNIRTVDINVTSVEEQRSTEWMRFESLKDFLDPDDPDKTVEGYPAPKRAVIIANAPA